MNKKRAMSSEEASYVKIKGHKDARDFASLLGIGNLYKRASDYQSTKNSNLGLRLNYCYNQKYLFDFSGAYIHSVKLTKKSRNAFSPTFGVAWLLSSEDFISSVNAIDYLKVKLMVKQNFFKLFFNNYFLICFMFLYVQCSNFNRN